MFSGEFSLFTYKVCPFMFQVQAPHAEKIFVCTVYTCMNPLCCRHDKGDDGAIAGFRTETKIYGISRLGRKSET